MNRRRFLTLGASLGTAAAWASSQPRESKVDCCERGDLYPEGVASGDPDAHSVLLWTRRPFTSGSKARLRVEVSEDAAFTGVIATASTTVSAASDWTCRVLIGNLRPSHVYWYRFIDAEKNASRVGRTRTAPAADDSRSVTFAFVSCQNINLGVQHAYRRMILEDERAPEAEQIAFVLHLGDFIYELVWYPEEAPRGYYGRRPRDVVRLPQGERIGAFHVPTCVDDYRMLYRTYLQDPDLQDARARWPFVCMWDNHEFSQSGWQSFQQFGGRNRPAQTRKVAANQAWFEYQPARVVKSSGSSLESFDPPAVHDVPVDRFDAHGFGDEANNRAAVASLTGYRSLRWGRHVDLIITDQRSYRSEALNGRAEGKAFTSEDYPEMYPQGALEILDAGRAYAGGKPPQTIRFGEKEIPNFRKHEPPQTILGDVQKRWFLRQIGDSRATWKIWGCSLGTLEGRADLQNLPAELASIWPDSGYACQSRVDHSNAWVERAEIYDHVRKTGATGFVTLSGDRHSFWAGLAAPSLPPEPFDPVGLAFVTGSIGMPGLLEKLENSLSSDHPLRALYLLDREDGGGPEPTVNLLVRHGVRTCLDYQQTRDLAHALTKSNPDLAPHLSFVDFGGHGYAVVRASAAAFECEFVCIPRPIEATKGPEGPPVLYRVIHRAPLWGKDETPRLEQRVVDGNPRYSL